LFQQLKEIATDVTKSASRTGFRLTFMRTEIGFGTRVGGVPRRTREVPL
jgi:hypothetical protein